MRKILIFAAPLALALATAGAALAQDGVGRGDRLMRMDLNHDGQITRAEAEQARAAQFARLDANHDGFIDQAERDAAASAMAANAPGGGQGGGFGAGMLQRADTNNDGRVSRDEFMNRPYRMFDFLDANHDGVISAAEIQAARAARGGT